MKPSLPFVSELTSNAAADEADVCTAPKITFTVTARNNYHDPQFPCEDTRQVLVGYDKYVSAGQPPERVELKATLGLGGSHTFTCTDAALDESGAILYVVYELFDSTVEMPCQPVPFEEGGWSRSFDYQLEHGGNLDVTFHYPSRLTWTIRNPDADADRAAKADEALEPSPDPEFAAKP